MVTYPISVRREQYRGSNASKRAKVASMNRAAMELEQYINGQLLAQEQPVQIYYYHEIAAATGVPLHLVESLCFSIEGGSNGFTAIKHGMTYEAAMEAMRKG